MKHQTRVYSYFSHINDWAGGFRLGSVNVITGGLASGKSTLAKHLCIDSLVQGYSVFMYSYDDYTSILERDLNDILVMRNYDCKNLSDVRRCYGSDVTLLRKSKYTIVPLLSKMEEAYRKNNARVFIIDSMVNVSCNMDHDKPNTVVIIQELSRFAKEHNVIIHIVVPDYMMEEIDLTEYTMTIYRFRPEEKFGKDDYDCAITFEDNGNSGVGKIEFSCNMIW